MLKIKDCSVDIFRIDSRTKHMETIGQTGDCSHQIISKAEKSASSDFELEGIRDAEWEDEDDDDSGKDRDYEISEDSDGFSDDDLSKYKTGFCNVDRKRRWTQEEKNAAELAFAEHMVQMKLPGIEEIQNFLKQHPEVDRTSAQHLG